MSGDLFGAFVLFAAVTTFTPGPNNTLLLASGLRFGVRRTLPRVFGIAGGLMLLMLAVGLGLGTVFETWPALRRALQVAAAAYLLWLAWGLARAGGPKGAAEAARPATFLEAAAFQWVNPKAWVMVLGAVAAYIPADRYAVNLVTVTLVLGLIGVPSSTVWAAGGMALRRVLGTPGRLRAFNVGMAVLLVLSLVPILRH